MGVTLERVQNKFACIIGELCNEPDVMSQFAIWVDLRISEYKTKGAISLECSGEDPNPTWLRGFKPHKRERTPIKNISYSRRVHQESAMSPGVQRSWDNSTNSPDGSDFVHIEPSPHDSVFPLKIEHNRKRSAIEDPYVSQNSVSPSKSIRLSNSYLPDFSQTIVAEPTNESLMSIIGAGDSENLESTDTKPSVETIVLDDCNPDQDTVTPSTSGGMTPSEFRDSNSSLHQPSTSNSDASVTKMIGSTPGVRSSLETSNTIVLSLDNAKYAVQPKRGAYNFPNMSQHPYINNVKARFPNTSNKSQKQVGLVTGTVGTLECWLAQKQNEKRNIEDLPAEEFDSYLADFYKCLKKKDGEEYNPESFMNFRGRLVSFLHEIGYPHNLKSSKLFSSSQLAFAKKLQYLRKNWTENNQKIKYNWVQGPASQVPFTIESQGQNIPMYNNQYYRHNVQSLSVLNMAQPNQQQQQHQEQWQHSSEDQFQTLEEQPEQTEVSNLQEMYKTQQQVDETSKVAPKEKSPNNQQSEELETCSEHISPVKQEKI